jgi:hypothetical protein
MLRRWRSKLEPFAPVIDDLRPELVVCFSAVAEFWFAALCNPPSEMVEQER